MSNNKISIILPVKNGRDFILRCISSFNDQVVDGCETELVIVNDHSTDNTFSLVEKQAEAGRVIVANNKGKGIIDALQTGYDLSSGNYISRMDADDVMPAKKLMRLYEVLQKTNAHVATGKVKYFHLHEQRVGDGYRKYENWLNDIATNATYYNEIYKECVVASPNWLIRRRDFDRAGGFHGQYPEDYDLVFRWYAQNYIIQAVNEITHHWYDHETRVSRNDDHYKENNFFTLKLYWFFKVDFQKERGIVIYGAGNKGKFLAKRIQEETSDIVWCSNNPKKIGKSIYGIKLISDDEEIEKMNRQIIVAIAVEEDKIKIKQRLVGAGLVEAKDFFFFS